MALPGDTIHPLRKKNETIPIEEGHVWIEGDEAFHSRDSNSFGTVIISFLQQRK
jgi:inner membrane protease subunit 2